MKTKLFILTLMAVVSFGLPFSVAAQVGEPLKFKNIPLRNTVDDFVAKMEDAGFAVASRSANGLRMKGTFVRKECSVVILPEAGTNRVGKVTAILPVDEDWQQAKEDYLNLKKEYSFKYGKPDVVVGDFEEFYNEREEREAVYVCTWAMPQGTISMTMSEEGFLILYTTERTKKYSDQYDIQRDI